MVASRSATSRRNTLLPLPGRPTTATNYAATICRLNGPPCGDTHDSTDNKGVTVAPPPAQARERKDRPTAKPARLAEWGGQ